MKIGKPVNQKGVYEVNMNNSKIILVSHGELAAGMKNSVEMIIGEKDNLYSFGLQPGMVCDDIINELKNLILNTDGQVIIIGDIFGGSVCNGATTLLEYPNVKVIAGMNMLLVINVLMSSGEISTEDTHRMIAEAKEGMKVIEIIKEEDESFF